MDEILATPAQDPSPLIAIAIVVWAMLAVLYFFSPALDDLSERKDSADAADSLLAHEENEVLARLRRVDETESGIGWERLLQVAQQARSEKRAQLEETAMYANTVGHSHVQKGEMSAASHCYRCAAAFCPDDPRYRANSALALIHLGKYGEAVAECLAALDAGVTGDLKVKVLFRHALASLKLANFCDARRSCEMVLELDPRNSYGRELAALLERLTPDAGEASVPALVASFVETRGRRARKKKRVPEKAELDPAWVSIVSSREEEVWLLSAGGVHALDLETLDARPVVECPSPGEPGARRTATKLGSKVYLYGGHSSTQTLHVLDLEKLAWSRQVARGAVPVARVGHTAAAVCGEMIVMGGWSASGVLADVLAYDPLTNEWSQECLSGIRPPARANHTCVSLPSGWGNQLLIYGGVGAGEKPLTGLSILNLDTHQWGAPPVAGQPPTLPRGCAARIENRVLYAGCEPAVLSALDLDTWVWCELPSPGPGRAFDAALAVAPGRVLLVGGGYPRSPNASIHLLEIDELPPEEDTGELKSSTPPLPDDKLDDLEQWDDDAEGDVEVSFEELLRREKEFQAALKAKQASS
jgi:tetratricopeptide (TPR) repeat protein